MNFWILKPIGKSSGRGISLVNDISEVVYAESMVFFLMKGCLKIFEKSSTSKKL